MRNLIVIWLLFLTLFFVVDAQDKKDKKNKKSEPIPVEVKLNLLALSDDNIFADDVSAEDVKLFEDGVEQKITYFAKKERTLNIGLAFDKSASMKYRLKQIIAAGNQMISSLKNDDEAFVLTFTDSDHVEVLQDWTSDKSLLSEAVNLIFIESGQTAVLDAVYLAAEKIQEREKINKSKRYAILLISDTEDRDSYYKFEEVAKLFQNSDLQIFLLSYADSALMEKKAVKLSRKLSLVTGGNVFLIPGRKSNDAIVAALKSVIDELNSNFVIGYTSTNPLRDGIERKLTVQISDSAAGVKRRGVVRESFIVPKE